MQEELRTRREEQYQLLDRLHAREETARALQDGNETLEERVRVLQERALELDARLVESKRWRDEDAAALAALKAQFQLREAALQAALAGQRAEKQAMGAQLHALKGTVLKVVDKQRESDK